MSPNSDSLFVSLLASLLFILLTFLITNRFKSFRSYTVEKIVETIHKYRDIHAELKKLVTFGKKFVTFDNEPYKTKYKEHLIIQKQSIKVILVSGNELHQVLHQIPTRPNNSFLAFSKAIVVWPVQWIKLNRKVETLFLNLDDHKYDLSELHNSLVHLQELPWEIALKIQGLKKVNRESADILQELYSSRVKGEKFLEAIEQYRWLYDEFQKIPISFRDGNKATVLRQKENEVSTIKAFQIFQGISRPSENFLSKVRQWKTIYDDNVKAFGKLFQQMSDAPKLFDEIPESIDVALEREELKLLAKEIISLQKTRMQPTIENLEENTKQLFEVSKKTENITNSLIKSQTNYRKLVQQFSQVDAKLTHLNKSLYEQSFRKDYPIVWDTTKQQIAEIENKLAELGALEAKRTTQQLEGVLEDLDLANNTLSEIEVSCASVESLADELRTTWQECGRIVQPKWLPSIEQLTVNIAKYAKQNWNENDRIETIYTDASAMLSLSQTVLPVETHVFIQEREVESLLSKSRELLNNLNELEQRKERIYSTLINIQHKERIAIKDLRKLLPTVEAILPEISVDKIPLEAATELVNLGGIGAQLSSELVNPKSGIVLNKVERVIKWQQDVYQATKALTSALQIEIDQKQEKISDRVKDISFYARQIIDPAVDRAQKYQFINAYSFDIESINIVEFDRTYHQLVDLAQKYQETTYCWNELEANVMQPLDDDYSEIESLRIEAESLLGKAEKAFNRPWPPTDERLNLIEDKANLENAVGFLKDIQRQRQTVSNLQYNYSNLKMRYRDIARNIQGKILQDKDVQNRFKAMEDDAIKRLQELVRRYFGPSTDISENNRSMEIFEQGINVIETIKYKYERRRYNAHDVDIALNELFLSRTTYIDRRTQNIQIHDITLSDGSKLEIGQTM